MFPRGRHEDAISYCLKSVCLQHICAVSIGNFINLSATYLCSFLLPMTEVVQNTESYCDIYFVLLPICTEWLDIIICLHNSPALSMLRPWPAHSNKPGNLGMNTVTSCPLYISLANEETSKYSGTVYGCYSNPQSQSIPLLASVSPDNLGTVILVQCNYILVTVFVKNLLCY